MAQFKWADLDAWALQTKKRMDVVTAQATADMLADIESGPSINRGGERVPGTIPRDTGALLASFQFEIGGTMGGGEAAFDGAYALIVGSMEAGDVATFSWGGGIGYAREVHYGANGVPGTYWRDMAADGWQGYVDEAVRKAKAAVGG